MYIKVANSRRINMNLTRNHPTNTTLELRYQDFHRVGDIQPGTTVICEKGILWLTQVNDHRDYLLKPGERMVISKRNNVLIEALSDAKVDIFYANSDPYFPSGTTHRTSQLGCGVFFNLMPFHLFIFFSKASTSA
jgi:hypothetical protein